MSKPTWIDSLTDELVTGINKFIHKIAVPNAPKPPPGTLTNYLKETIAKHAPKDSVKPAAPENPNEALTVDQIYVTPPVPSIISPDSAKLLSFIKSKPSCRLGDAEKATGIKKDVIETILPTIGYKVVKPGWIKAA